ncbi:MAG TPA: GNAT family N-acetyltransferase [Anaerolineaceae bacterium]|nr:GNAT family N-acetyltransferase [Anaerolineaceae bacterium]
MNRLVELSEDWKYIAKRKGKKEFWSLIISDLTKLPYRHLKFVVLGRSLMDPFPEWGPRENLSIRAFEQKDLDIVRQLDRPSEARLCAKRLAEGHHGLVALYNDCPAGYTWGSMDPQTRLERIHPKLDSGDVLCTDSFTAPEFRRKGIQTALTLARFHLFREMGCKRAICCIENNNAPSLAVWQRKLSSKPIGMIDFKRIGPWYRIRYS